MYKILVGLGAAIGGIAGAYLPMLWGDDDLFSVSSIIFATIGGLIGIFLGYILARKLSE